jgi:hypothetical protein
MPCRGGHISQNSYSAFEEANSGIVAKLTEGQRVFDSGAAEIPPTPSEILSSKWLSALLKNLRVQIDQPTAALQKTVSVNIRSAGIAKASRTTATVACTPISRESGIRLPRIASRP